MLFDLDPDGAAPVAHDVATIRHHPAQPPGVGAESRIGPVRVRDQHRADLGVERELLQPEAPVEGGAVAPAVAGAQDIERIDRFDVDEVNDRAGSGHGRNRDGLRRAPELVVARIQHDARGILPLMAAAHDVELAIVVHIDQFDVEGPAELPEGILAAGRKLPRAVVDERPGAVLQGQDEIRDPVAVEVVRRASVIELHAVGDDVLHVAVRATHEPDAVLFRIGRCIMAMAGDHEVWLPVLVEVGDDGLPRVHARVGPLVDVRHMRHPQASHLLEKTEQ